MLARPSIQIKLSLSPSNPFSSSVHFLAENHKSMVQKIEQSRQLIVDTKGEKSLTAITVKHDVLTLVFANKPSNDNFLNIKVKENIKNFSYGYQNDPNHSSWHFDQLFIKTLHFHIVKNDFDPENCTKLVPPIEFDGLINSIEEYPELLEKDDAEKIKATYANFYKTNTGFATTSKFTLLTFTPKNKDTTCPAITNEDTASKKLGW